MTVPVSPLVTTVQQAQGLSSSTNLVPEREKTDESLRHERDKTDQAVAARAEDMARRAEAMVDHARDTADAVLGVARDNADAVLDAARAKADDRQESNAVDADRATLGRQRGMADDALQAEREDADRLLRDERAIYARTLQRFLPLERDSTDHSLRSERIRADKALVNQDDFLAIVAHDLRDLLGGIMLSSSLLAKRAPKDEAGARTISETARIGRHVARMGRLIGDLLDIASVDAGKLAVVPTPGKLEVLIAEATHTFQTAAASRGVVLESRIEAAPLRASFDHDRLLQVLGNLLSNALKYTPKGGKITLVGARDAAGVQLTVIDTGCGIPEEALESVFGRFSQVDADKQGGADTHGGLGLGLYISRCLVESHGGSIQAQSELGVGTRICVRLPAGASDSSSTPP